MLLRGFVAGAGCWIYAKGGWVGFREGFLRLFFVNELLALENFGIAQQSISKSMGRRAFEFYPRSEGIFRQKGLRLASILREDCVHMKMLDCQGAIGRRRADDCIDSGLKVGISVGLY